MINKIILNTVLLFFVQNAFSADYFRDKDLPIPEKAKIKIITFEKTADGVFKGYVVGFDGEGPFYTRAEHLAKSIDSLNFKSIHKKPKALVGKTFVLNSKLETVVPPPVEQIEKK